MIDDCRIVGGEFLLWDRTENIHLLLEFWFDLFPAALFELLEFLVFPFKALDAIAGILEFTLCPPELELNAIDRTGRIVLTEELVEQSARVHVLILLESLVEILVDTH